MATHLRAFRPAAFATFGCILFSLVAMPATAQSRPEDRPLRAAAGYAFSHASQEGFGETFPFGFVVQLARDLKRDEKKALGFVARYSLGFHNDEGFSDRLSVFQFGARMTWHTHPLQPYVLGTIGFARIHSSGGDGDFQYSDTETGLAYAAGAGIRKPLSNNKTVGVEANVGQHRQGSPVLVFTWFGFLEVDLDKLKKN